MSNKLRNSIKKTKGGKSHSLKVSRCKEELKNTRFGSEMIKDPKFRLKRLERLKDLP